MLNNNNYNEFENRVIQLLDMDFQEYETSLSNKISYLIHHDPVNSTIQKLKKRILELTY